MSLAALVAVGLLAARNRRREPADEPNVSVALVPASGTIEPALTRRRWIRVAGSAGLAGAMGSWLGWPEVTSARGSCADLTKLTKKDPNCACVCYDGTITCCRLAACDGCGGFAGGGVVKTPSGSAQASFGGNRAIRLRGGRQDEVFNGALVWFDPAWQGSGLLLQLTRIKKYRKVPGTNIRELTGFVSANGSGKHPFVLRVLDAGKPGSGADTVSLHVSGIAASGAGGVSGDYAADGHLLQGDVTVNLLVKH